MVENLDEQVKFLTRNTIDVLPKEGLKSKLGHGVPLTVKFGADPTAPDIHLGHTVVLQKLKEFQDFGHKIIFIIGDYTATIGDPSGRNSSRPLLTSQEINKNAETYKEQVFKVLDPEKTTVVSNSSWLRELTAYDLISMASKHSVAQLLEREDFNNRIKTGQYLGLHELLYPLLQGFDSYATHADVELGGTDQKFNLLMGRAVQKSFGKGEQVVITMPLLLGTDGVSKMSKSNNNYIGISEDPNMMFGKIMSISDDVMWHYYELLTALTQANISHMRNTMHPKTAKLELAERLVAQYHSDAKAEVALHEFNRRFVEKSYPTDIKTFKISPTNVAIRLVDLLFLTGLAESKSGAKRLIEQGGVRVSGNKTSDTNYKPDIRKEPILQVGKLKFIKIVCEETI